MRVNGEVWRERRAHRSWLERECEDLLALARRARVRDGFGWLTDDGVPDGDRPLQLWITSRMTHVFALGHLLGLPGCGPLVDHGIAALESVFVDREHGGWYAEVGKDGPTRDAKEAYPHAFVLLAAASAVMAGREPARALLDQVVTVVRERFWAEDEGACVESWDRGWTQLERYRGANANMHMVEAFLAAGDATGDAEWYGRALRVAERIVANVAGQNDWRILEHFDERWRPLPDYNADQPRHPFRPFGVTPGHGLEWSRLLLQLRAALARPPEWLVPAARGLFDRAVADGWQPGGGFVYTTDLLGRPVVRDRLHWVLAEGIGASAALSAETGEDEYEIWYRTFWDFADLHLRDHDRGGWRHELDERCQPSARTWEGRPDVYHVVQATILPLHPLRPSVAGGLIPSRRR
jgi:mannose/cellobiose epimerase-like protein (N-acyl-D-glucosamine 2-epimerase family)